MSDLEIIDAHTHLFRSDAHGREAYGYFLGRGPVTGHPADPPTLGTVPEALQLMAETGVVHTNFLMFTWSGRYYEHGQHTLPDDPARRVEADAALKNRIADRIRDNNEWALVTVKENPTLSFFAGVDPVVMDERALMTEVEDKTDRGGLGVKLVPMDSGVRGDDRRLWPVYDYCQSNDIPVLTQAAGRPGTPAQPVYFTAALEAFPRLKLIFAHLGHNPEFGHGADAEVVELANRFENVFTDVSLRFPEVVNGHVSPEAMVSHLRRIGVDRVLYGSNFTFVELLAPDPEAQGPSQFTRSKQCVEILKTLPLRDEERERIASGNFRRVTGLR
jgi:predicted TIM-barrel fold metal-dependent hydrolase